MAGNWEKVRLGDLVKITHGWPFKSEFFTEERAGRPIIVSIGNFKYSGGFRFETTTIKEYTADYPKEYELTPGDILLVMTCQTSGGEILGIPARIPNDGNIYLHNQRMGRVVIKDSKHIDAGFVYYLALWQNFNRELCTTASGTKILHTAPVRIEAFEFNLPTLAQQKAIAAVLGALDDKIELNRRMNATLEAMARALFQSWFVDFDPVRAKLDGREPVGLDPGIAALFPEDLEGSPLGHIPEGWEVVKLKDLTSKIGSGATPRGGSEVYVDKGPALIRSQNVYDYEFRWAGLARLTDKSAAELKNVEVMKNDVLLNITGDSILRTCVVDPAALPARVNQHVAIIRAINGIPAQYLHIYLVQESMKSFLIGMSAGATRHAITKGHLESIDVLKPTALVLEAFEQRTTPWFAQIDANRSR